MKTRKLVPMVVMVSVPATMTARKARREVRTLINHQANWSADPGDVKVRRIETYHPPFRWRL